MGVRATLLAGSAGDGGGVLLCLAATTDLRSISSAASLAGLGFTLLATVPGTYLLARLFAQPSFAFGLYFTIGGLGGVAGPLLYFWVTGGAAIGAIIGWCRWCSGGGWPVLAALSWWTPKPMCGANDGQRSSTSPTTLDRRGGAENAAIRRCWPPPIASFLFVGITVNAVVGGPSDAAWREPWRWPAA